MSALSHNSVINFSQTTFNSWQGKLFALTALVGFADWLFYGQQLGISIVLFLAVLASCIWLTRRHAPITEHSKLSLFILLASLLPLIEEFNTLTFLIGSLGILNFTFTIANKGNSSLLQKLSLALLFLARIPFKFIADMVRLLSLHKKSRGKLAKPSWANNWLLPLLMTSGFLFLFTIANPLISNWISELNFAALLSALNFDRIIFWILIATLCWSFLKPSIQKLKKHLPNHTKKVENILPDASGRLNQTAVFRSLVLFNALFAAQTVLDFQYLWIGQTLPDGVTFSQYVHNGTYILILTTLLAACFILYVTGAKKGHERSPSIMGLLLLWTVQNIVLVFSNVMRVELYVEAFALTYLRLSVLIWLALVIIGLVLIIIRLLKKHSNIWLIKANLISLATVLYLTSFANLPYLIADYNIETAERNINKRLDINYLLKLGPNAIPIIDKVFLDPRWENYMSFQIYSGTKRNQTYLNVRDQLARQAKQNYTDWRQWNFRDLRLQNSLK